MKSIRLIATAGLMAAAAVLGSQAARAADPTLMTFTYTEESGKPLVSKLLSDFKTQSGITADPLGYAWGDMQKNIVLRQRSNTLPDVVQLTERWLPGLANMPELVDFNTVYGKDALAKKFDPVALNMGQVDGKQLALPWLSGSIGLIANKAVLAQAGITTMPSTIDDFKKDLIAVRDKVPNSVPYGMATKNNDSMIVDFMIWDWTFGGRVIDENGKVLVDSPQGKAALAFMADLMKQRLAAPDFDRPDSRRLFAQNASAFYFDAPQARTFARQMSGKGSAIDADILPIQTPVLKAGDTPRSIMWGHLLAVYKKGSDAPTTNSPAVQLVSYLTSDAAQVDYPLAESSVPTTLSARAAPAVEADAYITAWGKATGSARMNEIGMWSNGPALTAIVGEEVQAALLGQKSSDDAIASMQKRLEAAMAKRG